MNAYWIVLPVLIAALVYAVRCRVLWTILLLIFIVGFDLFAAVGVSMCIASGECHR